MLVDEIYKNFVVVEPPYDFVILRSFDSWDYDPEEFFSKLSWKDVLKVDLKKEREVLGDLADVCAFMTTEAFFNFLPAFMIISLDVMRCEKGFPWNSGCDIESSLTGEFRQDFLKIVDKKTKCQKEIIAKFLYYSLLYNGISKNGFKFHMQRAIENYWFEYLSDEELENFSNLTSENKRQKIIHLSNDEIDGLKRDLELNFTKDVMDVDLESIINVIKKLVDNNEKQSDQVLLNLANNNETPNFLRQAIKTTITCYGI